MEGEKQEQEKNRRRRRSGASHGGSGAHRTPVMITSARSPMLPAPLLLEKSLRGSLSIPLISPWESEVQRRQEPARGPGISGVART